MRPDGLLQPGTVISEALPMQTRVVEQRPPSAIPHNELPQMDEERATRTPVQRLGSRRR
ncbi:MAG: hypothetical protein LR015_04445 [Verrucomicrobia bacterium]|nr:hypothetical protein [Verrucomicrobiota bacterium]